MAQTIGAADSYFLKKKIAYVELHASSLFSGIPHDL